MDGVVTKSVSRIAARDKFRALKAEKKEGSAIMTELIDPFQFYSYLIA